MDVSVAAILSPGQITVDIGSSSNRQRVEALLASVQALAVRLKQASTSRDPQQGMASVARSLLGVLQQHGPLTVPQLARLRSTSRQNVQVIVNRLLADGYVLKVENPGHKRSGLLCLTPKATELLETSEDPCGPIVELVTQNVSAARVTEMLLLLRDLVKLLESLGRTSVEPSSAGAKAGPGLGARIERNSADREKKAERAEDDSGLPVNLL